MTELKIAHPLAMMPTLIWNWHWWPHNSVQIRDFKQLYQLSSHFWYLTIKQVSKKRQFVGRLALLLVSVGSYFHDAAKVRPIQKPLGKLICYRESCQQNTCTAVSFQTLVFGSNFRQKKAKISSFENSRLNGFNVDFGLSIFYRFAAENRTGWKIAQGFKCLILNRERVHFRF